MTRVGGYTCFPPEIKLSNIPLKPGQIERHHHPLPFFGLRQWLNATIRPENDTTLFGINAAKILIFSPAWSNAHCLNCHNGLQSGRFIAEPYLNSGNAPENATPRLFA
jgi:hypothetical protein